MNPPKHAVILVHPYYEDHKYTPGYRVKLERFLWNADVSIITLTDEIMQKDVERIDDLCNSGETLYLKTQNGDPEPVIGWEKFGAMLNRLGIESVSLAGGNYNPKRGSKPESGCLAGTKDMLEILGIKTLLTNATYSNEMPE